MKGPEQPLPEHVRHVLPKLDEGVRRVDLPRATRLPRKDVTNALKYIYRHELRANPSEEQKKQDRHEIWLDASGSIWPDIAHYALIRMTPAEIKVALRLQKGIELSEVSIAYALKGAVTRGEFPKRTDEEKRDINTLSSHGLREGIEERVQTWLAIDSLLQKHGLADVPHDRLDWMMLIQEARSTVDTDISEGSVVDAALRLREEGRTRVEKRDLWPIIERHARKGMAPREIREAVFFETGEYLDRKDIAYCLHDASLRKRIAKPSSEARRDVRIHVSFATDEEIQERVKLWLDVEAAFLRNRPGQTLPTTRMEWLRIIAEFKSQGPIIEQALPPQLLDQTHEEQGRWLEEAKAVLREQGLDAIPQNDFHWKLLASYLYEQRNIGNEEMAKTIFGEISDEEFQKAAETLGSCFRAIRASRPQSFDPERIRAAMVQHGDHTDIGNGDGGD